VFREALEAAIVVSVLLALVEQVARETNSQANTVDEHAGSDHDEKKRSAKDDAEAERLDAPQLYSAHSQETRILIKKLRIQVGRVNHSSAHASDYTSTRSSLGLVLVFLWHWLCMLFGSH
jgi:high-affinity Fe2+/Pb2+ permease